MPNVTIIFESLNQLTVQCLAVVTDLTADLALLQCAKLSTRQFEPGKGGSWKFDGVVIDPHGAVNNNGAPGQASPPLVTSGNALGGERLVASRREADGAFLVREGTLEGTIRGGELLGDLVGETQPFWLCAGGMVASVRRAAVLPTRAGVSFQGDDFLPAAFRWNGTQWQWRLLPRLPRKNAANPLHDQLRTVFASWIDGGQTDQPADVKLGFLRPLRPAGTPAAGEIGVVSELSLEPVGNGGYAEGIWGESGWQTFSNTGEPGRSWWSLGLQNAAIRLSAEAKAERGVAIDMDRFETLELRPQTLDRARDAAGLTDTYTFTEDRAPGAAGQPDLRITFAPGDLPSATLAAGANSRIPVTLLPPAASPAPAVSGALPTASTPPDIIPPPVPTRLWLRETEGFARLDPTKPAPGAKPLAWARSAVIDESRDFRLGKWLAAGAHKNAQFQDFSLLLDHCVRLKLVVTCQRATADAEADVALELQIFGPAVRLTFARHALADASDLPLWEAASGEDSKGGVSFQPATFLSDALTSGDGARVFPAWLSLDKGQLGVQFAETALEKVVRWRHLPGFPATGPADWAVNDPAPDGLNTLRGLFPVESDPTTCGLMTAGGALVLTGAGPLRPAAEGRGRRIALLGAITAAWRDVEIDFSPAVPPEQKSLDGEVVVRKRFATPQHDEFWPRAVPRTSEPEPPIQESLTWVEDRFFDPAGVRLPIAALFDPATLPGAAHFDIARPDTPPKSDAGLLRLLKIFSSAPVSSPAVGSATIPACLLTLAVRLDGAGVPVQWGLVPDAAGALPLFGARAVAPVALRRAEKDWLLTVRLTPAAADGPGAAAADGSAFAGESWLELTLAPLLAGSQSGPDAFEIKSQRGCIALPAALLRRLLEFPPAGSRAARIDWVGVVSTEPAVSAEGVLTLNNIGYCFAADGAMFTVPTTQTVVVPAAGVLPAPSGVPTGSVDAALSPTPADPLGFSDLPPAANGLRRESGAYVFTLRHQLPGLLLTECLIHSSSPARAGCLSLFPASAAGDALAGGTDLLDRQRANVLHLDGEWVIALSAAAPYAAPVNISGGLQLVVSQLNRVYLRLRRNAMRAAVDAPYSLLEAFIGWNALAIFGLRAPPAVPGVSLGTLHVTLLLSGGQWTLETSGQLIWPALSASTETTTLAATSCLWGDPIRVECAGPQITLAGAGEQPIPALTQMELTHTGAAPYDLRWSAVHTLRLTSAAPENPAPGSPLPEIPAAALKFDAILSLEPAAGQAYSTIFFRRPDLRFTLWDFAATPPTVDEGALLCQVRLTTAQDTPPAVLGVAGYSFSQHSTSAWRDFPLGPEIQQLADTGEAGGLPAAPSASVPDWRDNTAPSVRFQSQPKPLSTKQTDLIAYTLFTTIGEGAATSPPFWLRSPVREIEPQADPVSALPCVWLWTGGRLVRFWIYEAAWTPGDGKAARRLREAAEQMLAAYSWYQGAVLEYPAGGGPGAKTWELIDSPLLNRSLALEAGRGFGEAPFTGYLGREPAATAAAVPQRIALLDAALAASAPQPQPPGGLVPSLNTTVSIPRSRPAGPRRHVISLRRVTPFELDRKHPVPATHRAWLPGAAQRTLPDGSLGVDANEVDLSLGVPRPGEMTCWEISVAGTQAGAVGLSPVVRGTARAPQGDAPANETVLDQRLLPPAGELRYRDFLDRYEVGWKWILNTMIPSSERPVALGLISPDFFKQIAPDQPFLLNVLTLKDMTTSGEAFRTLFPGGGAAWRLYLTLEREKAEPFPAVDFAAARTDGNAAGTFSKASGEALAILLAFSTRCGDEPAAGFVGSTVSPGSLAVTISGPNAVGSWTARFRVETVPDPEAGPAVRQCRVVTRAELATWRESDFGLDETDRTFAVAGEPAPPGSAPLPAFFALVRRGGPAASDPRLVIFGADTRVSLPESDGTALRWVRRGKIVDAVPMGLEPNYQTVLLHGNGSMQVFPPPSADPPA